MAGSVDGLSPGAVVRCVRWRSILHPPNDPVARGVCWARAQFIGASRVAVAQLAFDALGVRVQLTLETQAVHAGSFTAQALLELLVGQVTQGGDTGGGFGCPRVLAETAGFQHHTGFKGDGNIALALPGLLQGRVGRVCGATGDIGQQLRQILWALCCAGSISAIK